MPWSGSAATLNEPNRLPDVSRDNVVRRGQTLAARHWRSRMTRCIATTPASGSVAITAKWRQRGRSAPMPPFDSTPTSPMSTASSRQFRASRVRPA